MGFKTISLDDLAYAKLRAQKRPPESFSDVIHRLLGSGRASFLNFRGFLKPQDADRLAEAVNRMKAADIAAQQRRRTRSSR